MRVEGETVIERRGRVRWIVILMLFVLSTINYADRATMSYAGAPMQAELGISTIQMGYIFSAFGWAYVVAQLPGGALIDRFGAKAVYLGSILLWSVFTLAQGFVWGAKGLTAVAVFFALRLLLGFAEAPAFPANARIVAAWFPVRERGTATAIFNSSQYFALVAFAPIMGGIVQTLGWHYVFLFMGIVGIVAGLIFAVTVYSPARHPRLGRAEYDYIEAGGGLVAEPVRTSAGSSLRWPVLRALFSYRLLLSVYVGQYFITSLTYFYATWFPIYLIKQRGMSVLEAGFSAVLPAAAGWVGGILGGIWTDALLRRGASLSLARKLPIAAGAILSTIIVACNFTSSGFLVILFMAIAFFGKGVASLGWVVIADAAPKEAAGLTGGIFNATSNIAGIVTPIGIGYLVAATGSFDLALVFVALHALAAAFFFCVTSGPIRRLTLDHVPA